MKILAAIGAAALAAAAAAADGRRLTTVTVKAADGAEIVDGLAAKVNGEPITIGEVMAEVARDPEIHISGIEGTNARRLYRDALDDMIDRKLILRDAEDRKLTMQDWVVDNRIREIVKSNFGGDINILKARLTDGHIQYDEWKRAIHDDLIINAMRYQTVGRNVTASPGAMRAEFAAHPERYRAGARFDVSIILVGPAGGSSSRDRAEEAVRRLDAGEDFAAVAADLSSDAHAAEGGLWKDIDPAEKFRPEIVKTLQTLKVGERAAPVALDGWMAIVRKDAERGGTDRTFAEAYDDVAADVKSRELARLNAEWIKRLRDAADIVIYELSAQDGKKEGKKE